VRWSPIEAVAYALPVPTPVQQWRSEMRVGDLHVLGIADGAFRMRDGFMNVPNYQQQFEDDQGVAELPVGSFVVPGEQTVLIDAGVGPYSVEGLGGGALPSELEAVGVRPEDVDVVAITHLHLDHDGWITTKADGHTFPNAVVYVGRADYEYFVEQGAPDRFRMTQHKVDGFVDLFDAGRVVLVDDEMEVAPGVVALPTPGHTPGHLAYAIGDARERVLVLGDAMYCPGQLTDADLTAMHDIDPALARRSRELIQREADRHGTRAVGCHFPGLQAARIVGGAVTPA
jgi:glyoxylase-like metal-dependent hydrolase (beta-lactamase superfamily II)